MRIRGRIVRETERGEVLTERNGERERLNRIIKSDVSCTCMVQNGLTVVWAYFAIFL